MKKFTIEVSLLAVGASKAIAGALMFDKIPASAISNVQYDNQPTTFNLTEANIESGQSRAVVPLFDDAHQLFGKTDRAYINTESGSSNAERRKEIHAAGFLPSEGANTALFGSNDDGSTGNKHYVSKENLAWDIIVPQQFK